MTKIQKSILETVMQSGGHLSSEQIFTEVRKQYPKAAIGTIYRNLSLFADAKKIRRVQRADGPDYFEANIAPHDHATCIRCGKMFDVNIRGLKDFLNEHMEIRIVSFDLTVNCVCPTCDGASGETANTLPIER